MYLDYCYLVHSHSQEEKYLLVNLADYKAIPTQADYLGSCQIGKGDNLSMGLDGPMQYFRSLVVRLK